ncbi:MAG: cytochrome c family protein [Marinifilaceae bacterium]|jgi:phage-related holin|nr:cytochrome c family protein [Marinifilaceae bacterium]
MRSYKSLFYGIVFLIFIFFSNICSASKENDFLNDQRKGERIFKGFTVEGKSYNACIECHNIKPTVNINWAPSIFELQNKIKSDSDYDLASKFSNPSGELFIKLHSDISLDENEIKYIKSYILSVDKSNVNTRKSYFTLIKLLFSLILIFVSVFVIVKKQNIILRSLMSVSIIAASAYLSHTIYLQASNMGLSQYYAPDQPIKFSHKIHVQQNKLDCQYCHHSVDDSKSATIPHTNLCLNCHTVVREGGMSGKFEIDKIHKYITEHKHTKWNRIHSLPDHVYFNHSQHVNIAGLDCTECHGDVQNQHIQKQISPLSMGWCIDCHKERNVNVHNGYYKEFDINSNNKSVADQGGRDCSKCHY